jgi:hypothetical protein
MVLEVNAKMNVKTDMIAALILIQSQQGIKRFAGTCSTGYTGCLLKAN